MSSVIIHIEKVYVAVKVSVKPIFFLYKSVILNVELNITSDSDASLWTNKYQDRWYDYISRIITVRYVDVD